MILAIHQPNFLPWAGYFHKIMNSDSFVILDDVDFTKNSVANRNYVKGPNGKILLTVPVKKFSLGASYLDVEIDYSADWQRKHLATFEVCYKKSPYFKEIFSILSSCYGKKCKSLGEFNIVLIEEICKYLGIKTKILRSSPMKLKTKSTERLVDVCKKIGASEYLSGLGGKDYMDESLFANEKIKIVYQGFKHPVYSQLFGEFMPNLSFVDMLFNIGRDSVRVLKEA